MKIVFTKKNLPLKAVASAIFMLSALWSLVYAELSINFTHTIQSAESRVIGKSRAFAEYAGATISRLDQIVLEARSQWQNNPASLDPFIKQQQSLISDIIFQIALIDKNGILEYSSLTPLSDRTDLSGREHFRVHLDSGGEDQLFVSRPVLGKISGKWSIQFTRPLLMDKLFNGVLVASVDPAHFGSFGKTLELGKDGLLAVVRHSGERMARFPSNPDIYDQKIADQPPYLAPNPPLSGSFVTVTANDQIKRIYGFNRLPNYGLNFLVAESFDQALAPYTEHKQYVLGIGLALTLLVILSISLLYKKNRELQRHNYAMNLAAMIFIHSSEAMMITDENETILSINAAFTITMGYTSGEAVGKTPRILSSGLHHQKFWHDFWKILLQTGTWKGEVQNRSKNGDIVFKNLTIDTIQLGTPAHFVRITIFHDTTDST